MILSGETSDEIAVTANDSTPMTSAQNSELNSAQIEETAIVSHKHDGETTNQPGKSDGMTSAEDEPQSPSNSSNGSDFKGFEANDSPYNKVDITFSLNFRFYLDVSHYNILQSIHF